MSKRQGPPSAEGAVRVAALCALGLGILLSIALALSQGNRGVTGGRCLICHVDLVEQLEASRHGAEGARLTCETCHGESEGHVRDEHNEVKPDRTFSPKTTEGLAALVDLCARCHQKEADDYREALAQVRKREPALPSCTGCHGSHRVARVRLRHASTRTSTEGR